MRTPEQPTERLERRTVNGTFLGYADELEPEIYVVDGGAEHNRYAFTAEAKEQRNAEAT